MRRQAKWRSPLAPEVYNHRPLDVEADFEQLLAHEHRISPSLGGRSVFGPALPPPPRSNQLTLFDV